MRVVVVIAAAALGTLLHGPAGGEPSDDSDLDLVWRAPPGCPDAAAVRAQIGRAAGGERIRGAVRARAIAAADGQWTAEVDVGDGPRILRGDTCDQIAQAAALVIAIALRGASDARPRRSGVQAGDPEVPWLTDGGVAARASRRPPLRWRPSVTATAGAMLGALPALAPMARAGVAVRGGAFAARVEAAGATARRDLRLEDEVEALVRVDFLAAAGSGCYAARWLWLCGGVEVGMMRAVASAVDVRASGTGAWVAGRAGPSTSVPISDAVDLVLEADASVPIAYPTFSVNGMALPGPDPVSIRTTVGVRVAIP